MHIQCPGLSEVFILPLELERIRIRFMKFQLHRRHLRRLTVLVKQKLARRGAKLFTFNGQQTGLTYSTPLSLAHHKYRNKCKGINKLCLATRT